MTKSLGIGERKKNTCPMKMWAWQGLEHYGYPLRYNLLEAPVPAPASPGPGTAKASLSPVSLEPGANVPFLLASGMAQLKLHK